MSIATLCDRCGEPSTRTYDHGADHGFWLGWRLEPVCDECYRYLDNREPPDPDGEAFRGHEAAAFQNEQLHAARRLK